MGNRVAPQGEEHLPKTKKKIIYFLAVFVFDLPKARSTFQAAGRGG
jgi:hypothetical protein